MDQPVDLFKTTKPESHLVNILKSTRVHHPNFSLLLGAGCSVGSGVRSASEMIKDWRETYYTIYGNGEPQAEFFAKCPWFQQPEEYSTLFEALYDQPSLRREFIESCIDKASPSWGYLYLVDLIKQKVFNTVFTTNFDDLINESCYLYSSDVRPIVCAHDSSIESIRISAKRPKIVKLHGDFLFDSIKNTVRELESLETNTRNKFRQFANEYGIIVVGYSGNDRSVMDTLEALLRNGNCFPHGIYWCTVSGKLSPAVDRLRRFPQFHLMKITGFDALMAEFHGNLSERPHPLVSDPYGAITRKAYELISHLKSSEPLASTHPIIERDIENLAHAIEAGYQATNNAPLPYGLLGRAKLAKGELDAALNFFLSELRSNPSHETFKTSFEILLKTWNDQKFEELFELLEKHRFVFWGRLGLFLNLTVGLISAQHYEAAIRVTELIERFIKQSPPGSLPSYIFAYNILNRMQSKKRIGTDFTEFERRYAEKLLHDPKRHDTQVGAAIILGSSDQAASIVVNTVSESEEIFENVSITEFLKWPILELMDDVSYARMLEGIQAKRAGFDIEPFRRPPLVDSPSNELAG